MDLLLCFYDHCPRDALPTFRPIWKHFLFISTILCSVLWMSVSLAVCLTSSKAASDNKNGNGLDFAEERRKRAQTRKKAAALAEKAKLSAAGDNKLNSTETSVTSNSTCQLLQLSSGQPLPSLLDELSSEFSVAHLSLNILAHERLQQSLEDRLAPRPGSEFCPSTNVVYMVHPNMAVTRETRINGRAIEVRYAGEYVFVDSESTYLFVNYVPCAHHNILW
ncbi:hypothetical protein WR25_18426 [Diploscapter pachys]|uniref:Uncharacterized protein n=1 Tax=Diploscapter pachys TaxID=2018661 RepID=A0A2A2JCP9_9BILA|nr:hypothetical protein WR25_18426 [Diploscapter pachys]